MLKCLSRFSIFFYLVSLTGTEAIGRPFKIAVIIPPTSNFNNRVGSESHCLVNNLIKKRRDLPEITIFPTERNIRGTLDTMDKISDNDFDIIVGTFSSREALAVKQRINNKKLLFVAPTASAEELTKNSKNIISVSETAYGMGQKLARFSFNYFKPKNVSIITNLSKPNSFSFSKGIKEKLKNRTTVATVEIIDGQRKYAQVVAEAMASSPDIIYVIVNSAPAAKIHNELQKQKFKGTLIGGSTIGGRDSFLALLSPGSMVPFYFVKYWDEKPKGPNGKQYLKILGKCRNSMVTATLYDSLLLANSVLKKEKSDKSGTSFPPHLKFKGITGDLEPGSKNFSRPLTLFQIKNRNSFLWKVIE